LAVSRSSASGSSTSSDRAGRCQHVERRRRLLVARLGGLGDPLAAPLDRRLVGEDQLQLDRLGVVQGIDGARGVRHLLVAKAADDQQHGVGRPHVGQQFAAQALSPLRSAHQPGQVDHLERGRHHLDRLRHLRKLLQPRVADVGHALAAVLRDRRAGDRPHGRGHARPLQAEKPQLGHQPLPIHEREIRSRPGRPTSRP
jgi:hypothetical protein